MPDRARRALTGAGILTALLVALYASIHIDVVQRADLSILRGFSDLGHRPRVGSLASFIARLCNPDPYLYLCAVPLAVAWARRRMRSMLAIAAILLGANVTTELLKPLLGFERVFTLPSGPAPGSWPSGHATAAMSLALCCVLAAPPRLRPAVAAAGAAFAVAVSYSFLSLEWHFPTDVLAGFLVAGVWTLLGLAAVWSADRPRPRRAPDTAGSGRPSIGAALTPPTVVLLVAAGLALLAVLSRPRSVLAYARVHEAFMIGALAIGVLALALATGVMLALRR